MNIVIKVLICSIVPDTLDRPGEGLLVILCGEELFCEGCLASVLLGCLGRTSSSCVGDGEGDERVGELVASVGSTSLRRKRSEYM